MGYEFMSLKFRKTQSELISASKIMATLTKDYRDVIEFLASAVCEVDIEKRKQMFNYSTSTLAFIKCECMIFYDEHLKHEPEFSDILDTYMG